MSSRKLFVELGVNDRKLDSGLRKSEKSFKRFGKKIGSGLKRAFSAASLIGGGSAAFGFAAVGRDVLDFEDALNRIEIQAGMTGAETDAMRTSMLVMSKATGISRGEVAGAGTALINLTGDIDFTRESLGVLTEATVATGASVEDLAGLAFSLNKSFGLESAEDMERGLSAIIEAGKKGAIPLGQMTLVLQQLSKDFSNLSGEGVAGAADLASALQVLRPSFGSAAEAGTGLKGMLNSFKKNSKKFKKAGIDIFEIDENGVEQFRSIREILDDFEKAKVSKSKSGLIKIMGRSEGALAFETLRSSREEFERLSSLARDSNAIEDDAAKRRNSQAFKLNKAWNDIKETIAKVFTSERIEKFVEAIEKIASLVGVIVDNLKGAALVFAALKIGPGLAGAAMSLGATMGPSLGAVAGGAGASGLGKVLGATAGVAAVGLASYEAAKYLLEMTGATKHLSNFISDFAMEAFGPWEKIAEAGPSQKIDAVTERFKSGETDSATYNNERNGAFEAQAYRASDAVANLVGKDVMDQKGMTLGKLRGNVSKLDKKGLAEYRELARQIAIGVDQGKDTSGLANKLASIIAGQKISVELNGNAISTMLQSNGFTRIQQ